VQEVTFLPVTSLLTPVHSKAGVKSSSDLCRMNTRIRVMLLLCSDFAQNHLMPGPFFSSRCSRALCSQITEGTRMFNAAVGHLRRIFLIGCVSLAGWYSASSDAVVCNRHSICDARRLLPSHLHNGCDYAG
jgi:hypothetical protein